VNVVLFAASWQGMLLKFGVSIENVPPFCVVSMVTTPFHPEFPVPLRTCSWVPSTSPVIASTSTVSRL
jgi:hypothetical protein